MIFMDTTSLYLITPTIDYDLSNIQYNKEVF